MMYESLFSDIELVVGNHEFLVLVIYDIINDKKRKKFSDLLMGFGCRVQKSSFEMYLSESKYKKLIHLISKYTTAEDNIRVYKIFGHDRVKCFGIQKEEEKNVIII